MQVAAVYTWSRVVPGREKAAAQQYAGDSVQVSDLTADTEVTASSITSSMVLEDFRGSLHVTGDEVDATIEAMVPTTKKV